MQLLLFTVLILDEIRLIADAITWNSDDEVAKSRGWEANFLGTFKLRHGKHQRAGASFLDQTSGWGLNLAGALRSLSARHASRRSW